MVSTIFETATWWWANRLDVCGFSTACSFIHSVFCLTTGPKPPLKRFLLTVRSRASSFKWEYPLLSLRSSSSFLHLTECSLRNNNIVLRTEFLKFLNFANWRFYDFDVTRSNKIKYFRICRMCTVEHAFRIMCSFYNLRASTCDM